MEIAIKLQLSLVMVKLYVVMTVCSDDDECWPVNPCSHHCHNSPGRFACSCPPGYVLGRDGRSCEDLDECRWNNGGCGPDRECLNTQGSYHCALVCKAGYRRNKDMFCIGKRLPGMLCILGECGILPYLICFL